MDRRLKMALFGIIAWLVPFVSSIGFYKRDGTLGVDIFLFKTIMILIGTATAAILLIRYFKGMKENQLREGIVLGISWFAISIVLDFLILLPLSSLDPISYMYQIGLRYLAMPMMTITVGYLLEKN